MGWTDTPAPGYIVGMIPQTAGRFYSSPAALSLTTLAISANVLYATPFYVPTTKTYTAILIEVTATGAGSIRLGIYSDTSGAPDALVLDAGTVTVSSTGARSITISQSLAAGWYWLAGVANVAPTVRAGANTAPVNQMLGFTSGTDTTLHIAWSVAFTYAALPNPFTGGGALMTTAAPRFMVGL